VALLAGHLQGLPFPKVHQKVPTTLSETELNMLHADAVMAGSAGKDNLWFEAIDANLLDRVITEMNTMNKYFARVVKYWDEFTSGRDGETVYLEGKNEKLTEETEASEGESNDAEGETTVEPEAEEDGAAAPEDGAAAPEEAEDAEGEAEEEAEGEGEPAPEPEEEAEEEK